MRTCSRVFVAVALIATAAGMTSAQQRQDASQGADGFRFRSGVELINVTASVTDDTGRFVSGLRKDDFSVFEDGEPQTVTHFSNERVPVSLGILLLTSTVLYLIPRTAVLGVVLLSAYLGGAVAIQMRAGSPTFETIFPVLFALLAWAGIYLRERRLAALLPLRK